MPGERLHDTVVASSSFASTGDDLGAVVASSPSVGTANALITGSLESNVHAILVSRSGRPTYERYVCGNDERWGQPLGQITHDASTLHDVRSVTKSIVSLLIGIAVENRWIDTIDRPVLDFFPAYSRASIAADVTVRHLLSMSAGLAWDETIPYSDPANSERQMVDAVDRCAYVLGRPTVDTPGSAFRYNGGLTVLLGEVLTRSVGCAIDQIAKDALFEPLGISDIEWVRYADGTPNATSGLRMRAPDLTRIGQLMLNGGEWDHKTIIQRDWLLQSTSPQISKHDALAYGLHWWLGRSSIAGHDVHWSAAIGHGGQRLYVVPSLNLVIVILAGLYADSHLAATISEAIFLEHVLLSLRA